MNQMEMMNSMMDSMRGSGKGRLDTDTIPHVEATDRVGTKAAIGLAVLGDLVEIELLVLGGPRAGAKSYHLIHRSAIELGVPPSTYDGDMTPEIAQKSIELYERFKTLLTEVK